MSKARLPRRVRRESLPHSPRRECAAHRAWVRRHHCSVADCLKLPIECAHVHRDTNGGMAIKPSDHWTISLCSAHHREQHELGETEFEKRYRIDMRELALEFACRSPHRRKLDA